MFKLTLSTLLLALTFSCTTLKKPKGYDHHSHDLPESNVLPKAYLTAVEECKKSENPEIRSLNAIKTQNKDLVWKKFTIDGIEEMRVLALTWSSKASYFPKTGESMVEKYEVWVTLVPQVKNMAALAQNKGLNVDHRLEQYLGLPPDSGHKYFVELWIRPEDLFRPAADPEVDDHEAKYEFSNVSGRLKTSGEYVEWYENSVKNRYFPDPGNQPYPWTRLGYTYDWNPKANKIGASEYVIISGSTIITNALYTTEEYAKGK